MLAAGPAATAEPKRSSDSGIGRLGAYVEDVSFACHCDALPVQAL